jgi:hypothetical protein
LANIDNPHGLRPVRQLGGGRVPLHAYWKKGTTTAVFAGDIVYMTGSDSRVLRLATTTGSDDVIGVAANYVSAASSGYTVWVYDDPFTVFNVQSDGTTDTDHHDYVGSVAAAICTAGSTTTGLSIDELDASSITSTGTASDNVFKIIGVASDVNNGSALAHADLEVLLFKHMYNHRSASV